MIFYQSIAPVKAMTFDLDDTLYDNHPYIVEAERRLSVFISEHYPKASDTDRKFWLRHKKEVLRSSPELTSDMGELRLRTLRSGLEEKGYQQQELTQAVQSCFDYFYHQRSDFQVDKTICSLLKRLSERVPLIAITNGNVNLEQIGIKGYFQASYHASLEFPMKPDSSMFHAASEALNIPPKNILHVGDNLEKDIGGARAAGFSSAWWAINRPMNLTKEPATVLPHVQLSRLEDLLTLTSGD